MCCSWVSDPYLHYTWWKGHVTGGGGDLFMTKTIRTWSLIYTNNLCLCNYQYVFLRGGQDVLGRDVSGWIIKYLPYSYKCFSGPRKKGLSLFIRFPNESKTSNVIIHSYTEKICIKMDPLIRFSSPCVRNNTQYTAQQNYAQFCIPRTDSTHFCFQNVSSLFSRTSDSSIRWCTC